MANSATVRTKLATMMQDHLSDKLVNLMPNVMPLVFFLMARQGGKKPGTAYGLGQWNVGELISGVPMASARREKILNSDKYEPIIQTSLPAQSDGKVMGMYDTVPTRANADTLPTSGYFTRPFVKWVERADPIFVWNKEIRRTKKAAKNEQDASKAVGSLYTAETESVLTTHMNWWNSKFWGDSTVAPSNVDADVWDSPYSVAAALKDDNMYCGVDRSLTANKYFRGNYVSAARPAVLEDLINEADYGFNCRAKGTGIGLLICGRDLMPIFKAEAKAKGYTMVSVGELPAIGEFGFKREIVRFNDTYVIFDPGCPSKKDGAAGNVVVGLNLDTWTVAFSPEANFSVDDPFNLAKTDGGKDAQKSQMRTEMMLVCEAPSLNAYWTNVG